VRKGWGQVNVGTRQKQEQSVTTPHQLQWHQAARDLGIEIETPFRFDLPDGTQFEFDVLVKGFGWPNGTVTADDYATQIEPYESVLKQLGYGWTVYLQPGPSEIYDRDNYVEMLREWGWCGPTEKRPAWL
jgi:hypothetical protein